MSDDPLSILLDRLTASALTGDESVVPLSAEDVADLLWLASYLPSRADDTNAPSTHERPPRDERGAQNDSKSSGRHTDKDQQRGKSPSDDKRTSTLPRSGDGIGGHGDRGVGAHLFTTPVGPKSQRDPLTFRTPEAPALPRRLELARALRPLIASVADPARLELDEVATVRAIAETDIWLPILRPALRPHFEVALVVDASPSMAIWYRTARELYEMLERHSAFASVHLWELSVQQQRLSLRVGLGTSTATRLSWPGSLRDPLRRQLVLVLSDCVGRPWQDGTLPNALTTLARGTTVGLVQMLPPYLWPRTTLGNALVLPVQPGGFGETNQRLDYTLPEVRYGTDPPSGPPIPVLTLEPERAGLWARLVSATTGTAMPAVVFDLDGVADDSLAPRRSGEQRFDGFVAGASPQALRLAGLLAGASPLNMHVARLIQRAMLPHTTQEHLAEVFLGGILRRYSQMADQSPEDVRYEFYPGVRERLRNTIPIAESLRVLREVSAYILGRRGEGGDFFAFLDEFLAAKEIEDSAVQPFAEVAAEVLRGLGGRYTELASRLAELAGTPFATGRAVTGIGQTGTRPAATFPPPAHHEEPSPDWIPLEKVDVIDGALRKKLADFWITSVEELVSTARSSNAQFGSGRAALAMALGMSEEALRPIISAAGALLLPDVSFSVPLEHEFGSGLFLDDYRDVDATSFAVPLSLPEKVEPLFTLPPPVSQGVRNTSVAFALAGAYQVLGKDPTDLSEQFIYWACKSQDGIPGDVGTSPIVALHVLQEIGVCAEALWPYSPGPRDNKNPGHGPPPDAALANAKLRRITSFQKLPSKGVTAIKAALAEGKPVLIGLGISEHWTSSWQGNTLGRLRTPLPGERPGGGHAMLAVGYREDESAPGKGYFIVRNSWGLDWARENPDGPGYCHVPYRLIAQSGLAAIALESVTAPPPRRTTAEQPSSSVTTLESIYAKALTVHEQLMALESDVFEGLKLSGRSVTTRLQAVETTLQEMFGVLTALVPASASQHQPNMPLGRLREEVAAFASQVVQLRRRPRKRALSTCVGTAAVVVTFLASLVGDTEIAHQSVAPVPLPEAERASRPVTAQKLEDAPSVILNLLSTDPNADHTELYPNGISPEGRPLLRIDVTAASRLARGKEGGEPKERQALFKAKRNAASTGHL